MKTKIVLFTMLFVVFFTAVLGNESITLHSKAAVAMDADSSVILFSKDMEKKIYPASTTKILTAILAIENLELDQNIVVSKTAISIPWDSSSVYLKEGEIISVNDLLYCLLLNSGNDAANVLAEAVSGDITTFVKLMNQKAKSLGCNNTHFNNAHGYSDDNHYTTALDMAKIFRYCIQNEIFTQIISTKSYIVDKTNKTNEKRYLNNTNRLILQKEDSIHARYYKYCIGGKTGYTDEAGRTLITFAKNGDKTVIVAVFGASSSGVQDVRYTDAINLFEYSFNNFTKQIIAKTNDYSFNYINLNKKLNYTIGLNKDLIVLTKDNSISDITYYINIDEKNLDGLDQDSFSELPVGTITFVFKDISGLTNSCSQPLYLKSIVKYHDSSYATYITIGIILIFAVILFLFAIISKNKSVRSIKTSRKNRRLKKS